MRRPNACYEDSYLDGIQAARRFGERLLESQAASDEEAVMANVICDAMWLVEESIAGGQRPWDDYEALDVFWCVHCSRTIIFEDGRWVDPEATGDDDIWRESCGEHDTFTAEHEPEET